jgi:hypothetical protein
MGGGEFDKRAKIFLSLSLSAPPAGFLGATARAEVLLEKSPEKEHATNGKS